MRLHHLFAPLGLSTTSDCLVYPVRETGTALVAEFDAGGWTPRPTQSPKLGQIDTPIHHALFARALPVTCGYLSGNAAQPIGCSFSSEECCFYSGSQPRNWGCCINSAGASTETYITACVQYGQDLSYSGLGVSIDRTGSRMLCPSGWPACITTALVSSSVTFEKYDCDTSYIRLDALAATTSSSTTSTQSSTPTSISESTSTLLETVSAQTISTTATSTPSSVPHTGSNVGAIAGGTVGGLVALALVASAIAYLVLRKKKPSKEPMLEISQYNTKP